MINFEAFEIAARAGWNFRRSKWTQPEWDRLPLEMRLILVGKAKAAVEAYSDCVRKGSGEVGAVSNVQSPVIDCVKGEET